MATHFRGARRSGLLVLGALQLAFRKVQKENMFFAFLCICKISRKLLCTKNVFPIRRSSGRFRAGNKIRRPLEEGPPGCGRFARSSIFDVRLQWNHIIALHLLHFHILDPLKGQSLISHVSCLRSCWTVYCTQKKPHRHQTTRDSGSGMIPESYENSSIFEPLSKATKAMKFVPRLPKIMKNRPWNHKKSNFYRS